MDPREHGEALLRALHLRLHAEDPDELASAGQRAEAKVRAAQLTNLSQQVKQGTVTIPQDPLQEDGTQSLVVFQVLRDDRAEWWSLGDLLSELYDVDSDAIGVAVERLREQCVVGVEGERFSASSCARHLDALGFICI